MTKQERDKRETVRIPKRRRIRRNGDFFQCLYFMLLYDVLLSQLSRVPCPAMARHTFELENGASLMAMQPDGKDPRAG